jgi:Peroxisomal biogenesis factor 11 (PEX11)
VVDTRFERGKVQKIQQSISYSNIFSLLLGEIHNARRLFRLLKTFKELNAISLANRELKDDEFRYYFSSISFFWHGIHWILDNICVLSDLKVINLDSEHYGKLGNKFRLIGLGFGLILSLRNWIKVTHKEVVIEKTLQICKEDQMGPNNSELRVVKKQKRMAWLKVLRKILDIVVAVVLSGMVENKTKKIYFGDFTIGVCELVSGLIAMYEIF